VTPRHFRVQKKDAVATDPANKSGENNRPFVGKQLRLFFADVNPDVCRANSPMLQRGESGNPAGREQAGAAFPDAGGEMAGSALPSPFRPAARLGRGEKGG